MCGLAGVFSSEPTSYDDVLLSQMSVQLQHRGPDAEGFFSDSHVALVHRRLKIIDLSDLANQPMVSEHFVLVFNGEIYNYIALREELERSGCVFKTQSDTEVLLQGLIRFEENFISRLEGDFSFCFYNKKKASFLLARDRFGVKPLYISHHQNKIYFSSEIKPLLAAGIPAAMNKSVLRQYFQYRYVGGHKTLFEGIEHFPPGYYFKGDASQTQWVRYYQIGAIANSEKMGFAEAFQKSVAGRLISDRPLNLLLSGGIDSSALAVQIRKLGHKTSTLTYSFKTQNQHLDEYPAAEKLALSLQFTPRQITEGQNDFSSYPDVIKSLEEPIGDSIILANSHLFFEAKKSSTVLLSGEGADELFSGYAHHRAARLIHSIKKVPLFSSLAIFLIQIMPLNLINSLSFYPARLNQQLKERLLKALRASTEAELFSLLASLFNEQELDELLLLPNTDQSEGFFQESFYLTDFSNWLPRYGLMRVDKLSMAHSLEVRVPYLSHDLVQAALNEGYQQNSPWAQDKNKFRVFCRDILKLSDTVVRKKKQPFFNPEIENLNPDYLSYLKNNLTSSRVQKYKVLNYDFIAKLLSQEKLDFLTLKKLNCILIFQIWCETFLEM